MRAIVHLSAACAGFSKVGRLVGILAAALIALAGAPISSATASSEAITDYALGTADKLRVTVFGEADLSGEFEVDSTGSVALPLIGAVPAKGRTIREFEKAVAAKLADGYLLTPRVNIEVLNYRPFFILGEVNEPGKYAYVNGMTVLNAVALAGGYTHRARRDRIEILRGGDPKKEEKDAEETAVVLPGDIIRIPERFF